LHSVTAWEVQSLLPEKDAHFFRMVVPDPDVDLSTWS